jgi:hypothetical protein
MIISDSQQYSEYGCNKVQPRAFTEVQALYGTQMTALSGGLVYEYTQEEQDYGLVKINANGSLSIRADFDNLQGQYNKLDRQLLESANPASTNIKRQPAPLTSSPHSNLATTSPSRQSAPIASLSSTTASAARNLER